MGAIASSSAPPESSYISSTSHETRILNNIQLNIPHSEVLTMAKQIQRYDSCGVGYSRIKSENYSIAEHIWELCNPYELANLACTHSLPQVRLYSLEGLCVLLKTMKNFGHSPYWRFRFQPTECDVEELEDILFCSFMHLQTDQEITTSMSGCTVSQCKVSSTAKTLAWNLLSPTRQTILEDMIIQSHPRSQEAEEILKTRTTSNPTLETYLLLERQLNTKPHLLQYIALFKKQRDIGLVIRFLKEKNNDFVLGGIKGVTVWPAKEFLPIVLELHSYHCGNVKQYLMTENHDAMSLFFNLHEAVVAYNNEDSVACLHQSYQAICNALPDNARYLHATLSAFYNVIPISLEYAELLFTMWKQGFIKTAVLELLLDISGEEKRVIRNQWYMFLMGTHARVGKDSAVQILTHKLDVLDLIFQEFDSFRKRSIRFLVDVHNPVWKRGTSKHFDKGLFCLAMSSLIREADEESVCLVLEHCIRNCTCHDACFVCEYASQVITPSVGLIDILLERSMHWNFYVHDPARMALLCMNDPEVDKRLEEIVQQPLQSLSVYKPVTEGCEESKRRWRSFM